MSKIIMRDQSDKSWINEVGDYTQEEAKRLSPIHQFSREEVNEMEDIEYRFMKHLALTMVSVIVFLAAIKLFF